YWRTGSSHSSIMSELKDCPPLKYYDFKPVEHVKVCPRYTAVLGRSEDDGIGIEELDTLQLELETLLSSASRTPASPGGAETDPHRLAGQEGDKRFPEAGKRPGPCRLYSPQTKEAEVGRKRRHTPGPGPGRPKSKNLQAKAQEYEFTDDPQDIPRTPKNDAPNRFWASVEPYCADITNEEIRLLEELLKPRRMRLSILKSQLWGNTTLSGGLRKICWRSRGKGARANDKKKNVESLLKKSESQHDSPEDGCPFGPLTQRLLQALVEENIISPMEDSPIPDISGKDANDGAGTSPRSQGKAYSVPHTRNPGGPDQRGAGGSGSADSEERPGPGGDSEDECWRSCRRDKRSSKPSPLTTDPRKQELLR
ncbi:hypothetical protein KUCAC02_030533, partial [Chaenocephalus aceratus]